jgi:hypothetical protein
MKYYNNLSHYAREKRIDWRTARSHLLRRQIVEMEFKKKKVIIPINEII